MRPSHSRNLRVTALPFTTPPLSSSFSTAKPRDLRFRGPLLDMFSVRLGLKAILSQQFAHYFGSAGQSSVEGGDVFAAGFGHVRATSA